MKIFACAVLSLLPITAVAQLTPSAEEHFRYNEAEFAQQICDRMDRDVRSDLTLPVPFDVDVCNDDPELRNQNMQITLHNKMRFYRGEEAIDIELVSTQLPFATKLLRDYYLKINGQYLWLVQQRRNMQRNEVLRFQDFNWNPDESLFSVNVLSQVYFPPDPGRKYDYMLKNFTVNLSDLALPLYTLYNFPAAQWQASMAETIVKDPSYLLIDPANHRLVHFGTNPTGHQLSWINEAKEAEAINALTPEAQ